MDNWLLIIVGVIFLLCIAVGYIRGFFKIGLSLLSSVLTIVIMMYLSPYVADALAKYFPEDYTPKQKTDLIEQLLKEWYEKQEYSKQESLGSSRGRAR